MKPGKDTQKAVRRTFSSGRFKNIRTAKDFGGIDRVVAGVNL